MLGVFNPPSASLPHRKRNPRRRATINGAARAPVYVAMTVNTVTIVQIVSGREDRGVRIEKIITTQSGTNMHSPRIANLVERGRSVVATIGKTLTMLMPMHDNKMMLYRIQNAESVKGRF